MHAPRPSTTHSATPRSSLVRSALGLAVAAGLALGAGAVHAEASVSPDLQARLDAHPTHEVVVTFSDDSLVARLSTLTATVLPMRQLPMAGAVLTSSQVREVAGWEGVESIYFNAPLEFLNYEAAELTGGHKVHDFIGLSGNGVTVAVIDSGIDAVHPDLQLGSKTVQNVKIVGDLGLVGTSAYLEDQSNTDTSSGHGTHVAGTVAGNGQASANDPRRPRYYDGIAPEADLIGLGTGEGLHILHALMGFDWALDNQDRYSIDVITNSWGSSNSVYDPSNPVNQASYEAYRRGMVVAFAAGNDGPEEDTLNPYAIVPWVINVGSGTKSGELSSFSSRGVAGDPYKHVDVVAPGSSIISTRALGTVLPALGPVVDDTDPSYSTYYAGMSGTSMATPFVAGTTALLLEANPDLSPDQIEQILIESADAMPAWGTHVVGGGYINVLAAVDLASRTEGQRHRFLEGITAWSRQGNWNDVADADALVEYDGKWQSASDDSASDGQYVRASVSRKSVPRVTFAFQGRDVQLDYPRDSRGGVADLYVDGANRGRISFHDATGDIATHAVQNLSDGLHVVELRGVDGNVYFDGARVDGGLFPVDTRLVEETETFTGTMGPSAENLVIHEFQIEVGQDVTTVKANLGWDGGVDLDLYLLGPDGNQVASAASLENPEVLEYAVAVPGTYTYQVTGYATVLANYTLSSTQVRAVVTAGD